MAVTHYDIVIAGGAMAGATLALALERLSSGTVSVAVIEPFPAVDDAHPGFDARSIALSYGSVQILKQLALWPSLLTEATAIDTIHVSDRGHAGMTDISREEYGVEALGYVVELAKVGQVYHQALQQASGIDFLCPERVTQIERTRENNLIHLVSGRKISCDLLVAADGAVSTCCQLMGLESREVDFGQVAVIANVQMREPHQGRAFERFTTSGPVALLPMSDNRMSLVWCLKPKDAERVMALPEHTFNAELQQAFGWRLGAVTRSGARASYPLVLREKERITSHRFVSVGNAAQALHPIAGQGFNLGIRDVISLAETVLGFDDKGCHAALSAYQQRREPDRRTTIELTAGMVHLFSNQWLPLVAGRNLSLAAMDNVPLLKTPLLQRTMGLVER